MPDQVKIGMERAVKTPTEILWLRDEILAELWRRNPQLADNYGPCNVAGAAKKGCTIGERPAPGYALGSGTNADFRFRPLASGVYLVAPQAGKASGLVRAPSGEILLAAGASVHLIDAAYPGIQIELSAPPDQPLPLGNLSAAEAGKVFALLARQPGMVSANAASVLDGGRVAFKSPASDVQLATAMRIEPLALKPAMSLSAPVQIAAVVVPPVPRTAEFRGTIDISRVVTGEQARLIAQAEARRLAEQQAQLVAQAEARRKAEEQLRMAALARRPVEFRGTIDVSRVATGEEVRLIAQAADAKRAAELAARAQPLVFSGGRHLRVPAPVAAAIAPAVTARAPVTTANPDLARLRAEVEAEIERDRARVASALQQQACAGTLRPGESCTVSAPRRFTFAG